MLIATLLRHAKSSWRDAGLPDFDRPLNARGREAAPLMGALMRRQGLLPDHILCSPAERARQTLDLVRAAHGRLGPPDLEERLYHATPVTLLRAIHEQRDGTRHLLLVGHNPGLHQLAVWLTGGGSPALQRQLAEKLPTGGLVVLTFDIAQWRDVRPGAGYLRMFARPRDVP